MRNNKGYSFVELIIVIVLIIVLSVMSLVSLTLITTARAKDASTEFGSELQVIKKKCMDMTPDKDSWDSSLSLTTEDKEKSRYGLVVYFEDGNFKMSEVNCYPKNDFYQYDLTTVNETVLFSKRIDVKYKGTYTSFNNQSELHATEVAPGELDDEECICILFDRHGNCLSGYGEYDFNRKNGTTVAKVYVSKNGTIEIR